MELEQGDGGGGTSEFKSETISIRLIFLSHQIKVVSAHGIIQSKGRDYAVQYILFKNYRSAVRKIA